jgi:undecaprenyl-diphosphatase
MAALKPDYALRWISQCDRVWCLRMNRISQHKGLCRTFKVISDLGNGVFWYALMLVMLVWEGRQALIAILHMVMVGLSCSLVYKWLKVKASRPRPFHALEDVICGANPLDQFSFPSGHTLHAVAFSLVAVSYYPQLGWLVWPFTFLVATSRMILGLHYPSDVLAGAVIGLGLATLSFAL